MNNPEFHQEHLRDYVIMIIITKIYHRLYLGSPIWWAEALYRCKVREIVPHTLHANLRKVGEPERDSSSL